MSITSKPFLYVSELNTDGEFEMPLPTSHVPGLNIEISRVVTYLPLPDQSDSQCACLESNRESKNVSGIVKKLDLNPAQVFSPTYNVDTFFEACRVQDNSDTSVRHIYKNMWNEVKCDPMKMFDNMLSGQNLINNIYSYFKTSDVVIFLEYGLHMNMSSRIRGIRTLSGTQPNKDIKSRGYAMQNYQMSIYGFDVNFKFSSAETQPDVTNSYFWNKFTNETFDSKNDHSIMDMIRYSLFDFGGFEFFRMPSTVNFSIRRQGYGFLIQFPDLDTFLCVTVTAGRLPYVVDSFSDNAIILNDRDGYEPVPSQPIVVLRKTESVLRPDPGEYETEVYTVLNKNYRRDFSGDKISLDTKYFRTVKDLDIDFVFDCPLVTEPLCDVFRYGLSTLLPIYGGMARYFWIFYAALYYAGHFKKIAIDEFFATPTLLMNFAAGNMFDYDIMHAMYPYHVEGIIRSEPIVYLCNPEKSTFYRLMTMMVRRNRSYEDRVRDVLMESHVVIGLDVRYGFHKLLVNSSSFLESEIQQVYLQSAEEFPNSEQTLTQSGTLTIVKTRRNIVINDTFFVQLGKTTNLINEKLRLRFFGYDENLRKKKVKFSSGDKVIIKGVYRYLD